MFVVVTGSGLDDWLADGGKEAVAAVVEGERTLVLPLSMSMMSGSLIFVFRRLFGGLEGVAEGAFMISGI